MEKATFDIFILSVRTIEATASVFLNLLTLICVVKYRSLRNPAGVLVAALAFTDTLHGLVVYTLPLREQARSICTGSLATEGFTLCAQLTAFMLIAMERRNSLLVQLNRSTKWKVRDIVLVVIGAWVAIATTEMGYAIGTPQVPKEKTCTLVDSFPESYIAINISYMLSCTVVIVAFYGAIAKIVITSGQQVAALNTIQIAQQIQRQRASLRITKMMALVFGVFFLLYFPMGFCFATIRNSNPFWHYVLHKLSICVADINFWINPAIYAWRNKQFRRALRQLFSGCRSDCTRPNNSEGQSGTAPPPPLNIPIQAVTATKRVSSAWALEPRREFIMEARDLPRTEFY